MGLAALVLALVALAGPASDTLLGAPCQTCTTDGTTTTTTGGTTLTTLTVTLSGQGTVSQSPRSCTSAESPCQWEYAEGATASPTATPDSGYSFISWGGACSGSGTCSITMDESKSVSASFADTTPPSPPTISVPTAGQEFTATGGGVSVSVSFSGSDGGGATGTSSFRCAIDNPSLGGATPCSSPWPTGSLGAGEHTVYVWARDAAGNTSAPASRGFTVVDQQGSTGGASAGSSGAPTQPAAGGSAGGTAGAPGGSPPGEAPGKVGAVKWRAHGSRVELRSLTLTGLAAGSNVVVACEGGGCPFKHRPAKINGSRAQLAGVFGHRALPGGTRITIQITAPGSTTRVIDVTIRSHKRPLIATA